MRAHHAHLKQVLDAVETFQNQLVTGVKLDARFSIDAVRPKLSAEFTFRLCAVATGFPRTADFAL